MEYNYWWINILIFLSPTEKSLLTSWGSKWAASWILQTVLKKVRAKVSNKILIILLQSFFKGCKNENAA